MKENKNDITTAGRQLTEEKCRDFNKKHPVPKLYSKEFFTYGCYMGRSRQELPPDSFLKPAYRFFNPDGQKDFIPHDGLVSLDSAVFDEKYHQKYQGDDIPTSHFGIIGHPFGLVYPSFDYLVFYEDIIRKHFLQV